MAYLANKQRRSSNSSVGGRHAAVTIKAMEHIGTPMLILYSESRRKLGVADAFAPQLYTRGLVRNNC